MIKGPLKLLALLALAVGLLFAVPAVATASPAPDCKTVVVSLDNRPDSGNHGTWATDKITRTAKVCHVQASAAADLKVAVSSWHYTATVIDDGTFVTVAGAGNSPHAGVAVLGGVHGWLGGHFTATFTAPAEWGGWLGGGWNGKTLTGAAGTSANPSTSTYVQALWGGGFAGNSINNDWTWTYWTCAPALKDAVEQWTDDYKTDGGGADDGDITGKACPAPSPSPSVTLTAPPTTSAPTTISAQPGALPVTGAKEDLMAGGGVALLVAGGAALVWGRKRRNRVRFEA